MLIPFERHVRPGSDVSFLDWSPLIIGPAQTAGRTETLSQLMCFPAVSGCIVIWAVEVGLGKILMLSATERRPYCLSSADLRCHLCTVSLHEGDNKLKVNLKNFNSVNRQVSAKCACADSRLHPECR